jgi:hypothetical protein
VYLVTYLPNGCEGSWCKEKFPELIDWMLLMKCHYSLKPRAACSEIGPFLSLDALWYILISMGMLGKMLCTRRRYISPFNGCIPAIPVSSKGGQEPLHRYT